jgi:phospholipid/cholesterol/gamma-HCH transport system ATP-binding protein
VADPVIQLRGVSVRFGRQQVLRGIDLAIDPHQTVCVIGESGCGKTVLL